jgi:aspartate ammonia-lyase
MRIERDALGEFPVPDGALYGVHTARARDNFDVSRRNVSLYLIYAIVKIKKSAALTHKKLTGDAKFDAISAACDRVLNGEFDAHFVTDALQGGAGTSANMNVNEVLANIALLEMGKNAAEYHIIHPIDDINRGQSTNDVYPTALRIAAIELLRALSERCAKLQETLQRKENEYADIAKLGRTELMDAVPTTLGAEFGAYAQAISRDRWRLYKVEERLRQINLGGAMIGHADGSDRRYQFMVIEELRELTGMGLARAEYPMDLTQNNDVFVEVSGLLKAFAVNLMKISNDFRLMSSGPFGGFGEVTLAAVQAGSSVFPGKVNPVIPEMVMQASMRVMANDSAITAAAAHGEFELNAFLPLIADSLLESLSLLTRAAPIFQACVETLTPNIRRCGEILENSCAFALSYVPKLGYDRVGALVSKYGNNPARLRTELENAADGNAKKRRKKS